MHVSSPEFHLPLTVQQPSVFFEAALAARDNATASPDQNFSFRSAYRSHQLATITRNVHGRYQRIADEVTPRARPIPDTLVHLFDDEPLTPHMPSTAAPVSNDFMTAALNALNEGGSMAQRMHAYNAAVRNNNNPRAVQAALYAQLGAHERHFLSMMSGALDADETVFSAEQFIDNMRSMLPDFTDPQYVENLNAQRHALGIVPLTDRELRDVMEGAALVQRASAAPLRDAVNRHNARLAEGGSSYAEAQAAEQNRQEAHRPYLTAFEALRERLGAVQSRAAAYPANALPDDVRSAIRDLNNDVAYFHDRFYAPFYARLHPASDSGGGS